MVVGAAVVVVPGTVVVGAAVVVVPGTVVVGAAVVVVAGAAVGELEVVDVEAVVQAALAKAVTTSAATKEVLTCRIVSSWGRTRRSRLDGGNHHNTRAGPIAPSGMRSHLSGGNRRPNRAGSPYRKARLGESGLAIIDLFRVADGRIVEHWDVIEGNHVGRYLGEHREVLNPRRLHLLASPSNRGGSH